ncbi:MAG: toll/interleukin-1 receptor domain-containing protein [Gammaproteobacteria bacterium]|nr:toll/interleukin-1 receptor domain-containing protein [Gammaproteobacteria bacterium]
MASIFFSYRKQGEDKSSSLRLADDFRTTLGEDAVFRDEKGLMIGRFKDQLLEKIESCRMLIAVIGPTWLQRIGDLHKESDWVRREIEIALERDIQIAPVLVDGARQPAQSDLPDSLAELFEFQFITIHAKHWKTDVDDLISSVADHLNIERIETTTARTQSIPDLSGLWTSTEGETIQLVHQGDSFQMSAFDIYGQAIGQGTGSISGNQTEFSLQRIDIGFGSGRGSVSPDGRRISGEVHYGMQRFPFSLIKR